MKTTALYKGSIRSEAKVRKSVWPSLWRDRWLYIFLIPVIAYFLIFKYVPIFGFVIAFKDYTISKGIFGSAWVGLEHFQKMLNNPDFYIVLTNTIFLNVYLLLFSFPVPVVLAILLDEVSNKHFKKTVQSVLYVPYFISWAVLGAVIVTIFSPGSGIVNSLIKFFGKEPIFFMIDKNW